MPLQSVSFLSDSGGFLLEEFATCGVDKSGGGHWHFVVGLGVSRLGLVYIVVTLLRYR